MSVMDFLYLVLGQSNHQSEYIYYIIGGVILLITIDAIISFILSGISSLFTK